ncbi:MAG: GntR family transcriptional regulator [Oscillospiraceae bacterium]|nr:GntR family transcriptional regulator [Oscillospiraceae bacterium]
MIHLDYRDARPIYSQIVDGIRQQILAGILPDGTRLPSVRELATQLTINPNTIQRAYRELEAQGWIATVSGKGCFVCGVPENADKTAALTEFDKLTRRLLALGVTRSELQRRLEEGGSQDA